MDKFNIKDSHPNISKLEKLFPEEGVLTKFKKNDYPSFIKQATSTVNIQATTECEVYLLSLNHVCRDIPTLIRLLLR